MRRVRRAAGVAATLGAMLVATATAASAADDTDELLFYDDGGVYRFYDVSSGGSLGNAFLGGSNYTRGWDVITAVDLDGDGQDEMLYYREDGLYAFYDIRADGTLGAKIRGGSNYTRGWDSIVALDLEGDGRDELLFYRQDGLYAFFDVSTSGSTGTKIRGGTNYTRGWSSITGLDLEGDGRDELLFYRTDGLYAYFDVSTTGGTGTKIKGGTYSSGWDQITPVDLDNGQAPRAPSFGDGEWAVGSTLPPGTYRTFGQTFPEYCYWERLSSYPWESEDDVITAGFTGAGDIVTIGAGDAGFYSEGCGWWTANLDVVSRNPTATLPAGTFRVGEEMAPGDWASSGVGEGGCVWARVAGFSWEESDILAFEEADSATVVTIESGDAGFYSEGCGTWTYLGAGA